MVGKGSGDRNSILDMTHAGRAQLNELSSMRLCHPPAVEPSTMRGSQMEVM
jgi:hypothetical protein